MFKRLPAFLLVIASLFFIKSAHAQLTEAALKGAVTDPGGYGIVASQVNVKNESTGEERSTKTDSSATFTITALSPGTYKIMVTAAGFKTFEQSGIKLSVGLTTDLHIRMEVGELSQTVEVHANAIEAPVATDGRLADNLQQQKIVDLPLANRDVFGLPRLSAGATIIPGAALSTKLTNSPVITVNGNRYRGNNYVLDGSMNTNPNNTGEPAIVPSLESVEEVQVQTGNFSGEFGRGNGAVVNLRTKSGTNLLHGAVWEYNRNAALSAKNFFAVGRKPPLVFNQFGGTLGGPIAKDKTFFFASYEGTRNAAGQALNLQVETPEFREFVSSTNPSSIAARLMKQFPAPAPTRTAGGKYVSEVDITPPGQSTPIPALGLAAVTLKDYVRFDQYLGRIDHSLNGGKDKLTGRWIAEYQRNNGATSSSPATLGQAVRGERGPFNGYFGNLNIGHTHLFNKAVNDARFSFQTIDVVTGSADASIPQITIVGVTAPFGDIFKSETRLRTYEVRDTFNLSRGSHEFRFGGEFRRIFKGLSIAPPTPGSFAFNSLLSFANDQPFRQTLTVNPITGQPTNFPRYFRVLESGLFVQDDWRVNSRLNVSLGLRHDYFGPASERDGLLSSLILGPGNTFEEQLANASIGHVKRLYSAEKFNFSPRIGLAYDPFGDRKMSIRAGFSIAHQPHHGQSIAGARALPPDAVQGIIQPSAGIGTSIFYNIPVPFNPQFARGLNPQGGVPGLAITGFVVNPSIKTQYSENWFFNIQRELAKDWIVEVGYVGTDGVNLERIDDVNRFAGDLTAHGGKFTGINHNFGPLLFVTNGVSSSYNALTAEVRHNFSHGLSLQANYRWSKWLDTASDTSTGQFTDNTEPGKGAQDISCLHCERSRSLFDIPQRFATAVTWAPGFRNGPRMLHLLGNGWQVSTIITAQSGRPFSVWNGAPGIYATVNGQRVWVGGGDYNGDGGGGAVGGGFYDRPDAPLPGTIKSSFSNSDFINGLFTPGAFPIPTPGTNGTLGRNTFRGPHYITEDVSLSRAFSIQEHKQLQIRAEAFNALNNVNLYLPVTDLSLGAFGKSIQAFEPRTLQISAKFTF